MSNILIVPWPEWGHVIPPLRLGRDLCSRGHRVFLAVPSRFHERVKQEGLQVAALQSEEFAKADALLAAAKDTASFEAGDRLHTECIVNATQNGELAELMRSCECDVVIADDLLPAAVIVAWQLGIPCMQFADSLPIDALPITSDREEKVQESVERDVAMYESYLSKNPALNSFAAFAERAGYKNEWMDWSPICHGSPMKTTIAKPLFLGPPALSLAPAVRDRFEFLQSLPNPNSEGPRVAPSNSNIISLTLGNYAARYERGAQVAACLIEAMAELPDMEMQVIAFPSGFASRFAAPSNVAFLGFVDQQEQLRNGVRLMCTHGGFGTTKECAYAGTPMFVVPHWFDQYRNAAIVDSLGFGTYPGPSASLADIRSAFLKAVRNESTLLAGDAIRKDVLAHESKETGADFVEDVLSRTKTTKGEMP